MTLPEKLLEAWKAGKTDKPTAIHEEMKKIWDAASRPSIVYVPSLDKEMTLDEYRTHLGLGGS